MFKIEITGGRISQKDLNPAIKESGYYKPTYETEADAKLCLIDAFRYLRDTFGSGLLKLRPSELQFDLAVAEIIEL